MRKKFFSLLTFTALSCIISTSTPVLAGINYDELVNKALTNKTFYDYNVAYLEVIKLEDETKRNELLSQLAAVSSVIYTKDIKHILRQMNVMISSKSAKIYDQIELRINDSNISDVDRQYLLGELSSWGKQLVWTDEYKKGVSALCEAWTKKDDISIASAEKVIDEMTDINKNYLQEQLKKLKKCIEIEKTEISADEKIASAYVQNKGYELTGRLGKTWTFTLEKSSFTSAQDRMFYSQLWSVQSEKPEKYYGKEITVYGFTVKKHPLEKMYDTLTNVYIMMADNQVIGGYSTPDKDIIGGVYSLDASELNVK